MIWFSDCLAVLGSLPSLIVLPALYICPGGELSDFSCYLAFLV